MNHISIQSLFLNYSNSIHSNLMNEIIIKNVDENIYNNWKFWNDCSSYFN